MLQELVNHNEDLRKLQNEGYELEMIGGYLVIHHIPYVANVNGALTAKDDGVLVAKLNLTGNKLDKPFDHTAFFKGLCPCNIDGSIISGLINNSNKQNLGNGLSVDHYLSNKPIDGVEKSYYDKIKRYESIISRPAEYLDQSLTAKTYKPIRPNNLDSPFKYIDTMSSRYDIQAINDKLKNERIAIIGLGGTGSYVLDFVAKTPVKEIHLFDGDVFSTHNAFRAPGAASFEELCLRQQKANYFACKYENMRDGIVSHAEYLTEDNIDQLLEFDFVFVCIDNGRARKLIIEFLGYNGKSFIDTGMGLCVNEDEISGIVRTTCCNSENFEAIKVNIPLEEPKAVDAYKTNIQISELNALNAALAVIKWKQTMGFYYQVEQDSSNEIAFTINDLKLLKQ
ncbi:MAG: ThiF family adenylyltransferase [Bacteroidales bacterium]|nr:ThiF family adenylyltransferase [Bacteroidales bacterium]